MNENETIRSPCKKNKNTCHLFWYGKISDVKRIRMKTGYNISLKYSILNVGRNRKVILMSKTLNNIAQTIIKHSTKKRNAKVSMDLL